MTVATPGIRPPATQAVHGALPAALAIIEKALGPEHPHLAKTLDNFAALLRQTARANEAGRMEARANAIRAKSD